MTEQTSRFLCPSVSLSLSRLLFKSRQVLLLCMAGAVMIHLSLGWLNVLQQEERVVKPLTTQFIKRQPRLTKPLEMKKRPRPKRRRIQRKMMSAKARVNRQKLSTSLTAIQVVGDLARPTAGLTRSVSFTGTDMEPSAIADIIEGTREPEKAVDMSLEMLDIDALDTGRYHAMVIQDPDKRKIRGFFHVAIIVSRDLAHLDDRTGSIQNLVRCMNQWTDIRTDIMGSYPMGDNTIFKVPIIFIGSNEPFKLNPSEALNLGKYMIFGGFVMADDAAACNIAVDHALTHMFDDAFSTVGYRKGVDWEMCPIPNNHDLYHCYFDFPDGPPIGRETYRISHTRGNRMYYPRVVPYLHGVFLANGSLVGIFTEKDYTYCWDPAPGENWVRQEQMGINMIIFALTREGSITNRVMNIVR